MGTGTIALGHAIPSSTPARARAVSPFLLFSAVVVIAWGAVAAGLIVSAHGTAPDDAFITYRYASNLAHGNGLVFNPGEHVMGTTEPGWAVLVGGVAALLGRPAHEVGLVLYGLSLMLVAALGLIIGRRAGRLPEAVVAGTMIVCSDFLWRIRGFGVVTGIAMLMAAALLATRRARWAGVLVALAPWFRPELGLGAVVLAALLWREHRRVPWRLLVAAATTVATTVAASWWWFGAVAPHTLVAKRAVRGIDELSWSGFWTMAVDALGRGGIPRPELWCLAAVAGTLLLVIHAHRAERLLGTLALLVVAVQPFLGAGFSWRYVVIPVVVGWYGCCAAVGGVGRLVTRWWRRIQPSAGGLLSAVVLLGLVGSRASGLEVMPIPDFQDTYRRAGLWLRRNAPPDATVATTEIGHLGYWSDRPVHDLMGLVTPFAVGYVRRGAFAQQIRDRRPEYFLLQSQRPRSVAIAGAAWFRQDYHAVWSWHHPRRGGEVVLFRRRLPRGPGSSDSPCPFLGTGETKGRTGTAVSSRCH